MRITFVYLVSFTLLGTEAEVKGPKKSQLDSFWSGSFILSGSLGLNVPESSHILHSALVP